MKYTSAEANKLLRKLNEDYLAITDKESHSKTFLAALGEDPETVRPKYNYADTQAKLNALEEQIRRLKHTINVFNATQVIPEFNVTVDEMLVLIPQLTQRKAKLWEMKSMLPKQREAQQYNRHSQIIDYRYTNYSIEAVEKDYEAVTKRLSDAQTALDRINNTVVFDFD